jgi:hypothetical protein
MSWDNPQTRERLPRIRVLWEVGSHVDRLRGGGDAIPAAASAAFRSGVRTLPA